MYKSIQHDEIKSYKEMNPADSYKALVKNIATLDFTEGHVPCDLLLTGDKAFPVVVNAEGQVLIAASQYGKGRLVVVTHEGYISSPHFTQFIENAIQWLKPSSDSLVGVHKNFLSTAQLLSEKGHSVEATYEFSDRFGVYCTHADDDRQANELIMALKEGCGLLIGGQAWYWVTKNKFMDVLLDFPGNKVTSVAGIQFLSNYGQKAVIAITPEIPIGSLVVKYNWDISEDMKQLMNGITELRLFESGTPSHLLLHGQRAFPLVLDESNKTYLAACYYGKGRVVVATHEHQISKLHQMQLIPNLISWLDAGRKGEIGVQRDLKELQVLLSEVNIRSQLSDMNKELSVYCCTSYTDKDSGKILEFVAEGGGLLIAGQAWYWSSQNPGIDEIVNYPGNKIINQFGISIVAEGNATNKLQALNNNDPSQNYQCRKALFQLQKVIDNNLEINAPLSSWMTRLAEDCATILEIPENTSHAFYPFKNILTNLLLKSGMPAVSKERPVKGGSIEAFLLRLAAGIQNTLPNFDKVKQQLIPETSTLPVSPPQRLEINGTNQGLTAWRSTGLYAPPGKTATVNFPITAVNVGLEVQIGCHSDDLSYLPVLKRPPVVIQRYSVNKATLAVSNIFGGLIYIVIPSGCSIGKVQITIEGAVLAPYFKHGETTVKSWVENIRHYPAPWAELKTENIIFTVPSEIAASLLNPEEPLSLWSRITAATFELSGLPAVPVRPERFVADVQISQGWMHSGYPIMCHMESSKVFLDHTQIAKGTWGATHELGHNQQLREWELPPHTNEAMCNIWAVYVHENVLGIPRENAHFELKPQNREKRIKGHLGKGAPLEEWTLWLCLETYLQLQEGFGWAPYIKLFSKYQNMVGVQNENIFKMNLWTELFSQEVQKNLIPFFKTWGWPIDKETEERISSLPGWDENPMKKYLP
ncbi:TRPM8 channel-associated factor homolog [Spea bombifrons]|uniref:TRPM8 channel-associated factor homolog n=1 Tax=Spea bombifrons TaxID=233779 RepID=UPI002349A8EF|nr:TRPM8 channel-associated factor homolog [Spea bombifrons]